MKPSIVLSACLVGVVSAAGVLSSATPRVDDEHERLVIVAMGRATFEQFCAPCHGVDGRGVGPISALLTAHPTDLRTLAKNHGGRLPLEDLETMLRASGHDRTTEHRSDQMPVWGPVFLSIDGSSALAHARMANLLAYLDSIQQ